MSAWDFHTHSFVLGLLSGILLGMALAAVLLP